MPPLSLAIELEVSVMVGCEARRISVKGLKPLLRSANGRSRKLIRTRPLAAVNRLQIWNERSARLAVTRILGAI